jgi:hypothetical protein
MAEGSVQPPAGLIREVALRMCSVEPGTKTTVGHITMTRGFHGSNKPCEWCLGDADAVLSALFDACEVREQWGAELVIPGHSSGALWCDDHEHAEHVRLSHRPLKPVTMGGLVRRLMIATPPESW